MKNKKGTFHFL